MSGLAKMWCGCFYAWGIISAAVLSVVFFAVIVANVTSATGQRELPSWQYTVLGEVIAGPTAEAIDDEALRVCGPEIQVVPEGRGVPYLYVQCRVEFVSVRHLMAEARRRIILAQMLEQEGNRYYANRVLTGAKEIISHASKLFIEARMFYSSFPIFERPQ